MSTTLRIWLSILLAATIAYAAWAGVRIKRMMDEAGSRPSGELAIKPTRHLADFTFTERSGRKIRLNELEGKIFVVNFFWANCPMSCRRLNETVRDIQKEFKDSDIQFVSITVEPTIDTPERLQAYADSLNAPTDKWWFLNAPLSETQDLGMALKVNVAPQSHTDALVVVDRAGIVRGAYDFKNEIKLDNCKKKLRKLLEEQPVGWKPAPGTAPPTDADSEADDKTPSLPPALSAALSAPSATASATASPSATAAPSATAIPSATASATAESKGK